MQTSAKRIAKNSIAFFFARIIDILAGLLSTVLIARYLGVREFGDYAFIISLVGFVVSITYFGLERIAIRELARNKDMAGQYLGAAVVTRWILSALAVTIIAIFLAFSSLPFNIISAIVIATISELIWASGAIFTGTFKAFEKIEYETLTTFLYRVITLFFIGVVIYFDTGFIALFIALALANILRTSIVIYLSNTRFVRPSIKLNCDLWKLYIKEAYILGLAVLFSLGSFRSGHLVLRYFKGAEDVALFQAALTIIIQIQILPLSIAVALFPSLSRLAVSSSDTLGEISQRALRYLLILSFPVSIVLFVFSETIIATLFGKGFAGASPILNLLAWCLSPLFLNSLMEFILISINRQKDVAKSSGIAFTANVLLNLLLVPFYGPMGAAISLLSTALLLAILQYFFVSYHLRNVAFLSVLPKLLPAFGVVMLFLYWFRGGGLPAQFLVATASIVIYFATLFAVATFSFEEIEALKRIIK